MTGGNLWLASILAGLAGSAYGCSGDVYGGTHPIGEDCEYGCEVGHQDSSHPWGTPATSSDGGQGGESGGSAAAGAGGDGGAAGAETPGGHGGQGGHGGG